MAPGQMALFDPTAISRAQRRYPEALRFQPTRTGRVLAILPGGTIPAAPVAAQQRRAA